MKKIAALLFILFTLTGWSTREAHERANDVLVEVGDWCSGIVIDKARGLVATAWHCVKDEGDFFVTYNGIKETQDGKGARVKTVVSKPQILTRYVYTAEGDLFAQHQFEAVLLGSKMSTDVALLKITTNLQNLSDEARMSKVPVRFGDVVYTMGHPLEGYGVVSKGEVRQPKANLSFYRSVILHDAPMNKGSSGGGLFNDAGELVGLTNWVDGKSMWASPISNVKALMYELKL